jgi:signal transduction histidine kinase/CheY-like chemotaxis protein/HPt (histidine-containing phosphotransfer) domain-containing protein
MTNESYLQQKIVALEKECHHLRQKLAELSAQQIQQEKKDEMNRRLLKQTNEKLLQCNALSQRENISKSDFLANMSHEIRTPLNIILGMANLLAETELDQTQMQYLSSLRVTGRQLMEILNNVLEFSRIEAGKIIVEPEPFSLQKIIQQIEASALPLCLQKKLKFMVEHDPLLVMERIGDPLKIFQILLNLINNAVKFTQSGSITFAIREDFKTKNGLILAVIDTGIGISSDQQKIIFDRFTQANDSLCQQQGGSGLGLAISQKLTNAMGGELIVKSTFGKGSIFSCHLPLPPAAPSERGRLRLDASLILPENFPSLNILAVDDIKENLEVIKMYLKDYPVTIQAAENGKEALELFATNEFDLILMDVRMPIMDGISAAQEIRNKEKSVMATSKTTPQVILAITAHAFQEQKNKFLSAGFDGVLTKPFFKRELIQTLFRFSTKDQTPIAPEKMGNKAIGYCLENYQPENIPESLREMLPDLFQTISENLTLMKTLLQDEDYENIYETAHSLKGVAGMFGFQKLASLITDLSQTVKARDLIVVDELFAVLDTYVIQLKIQFN